MPFISSKCFEKEQTNHNIYDEAEMNENMQYLLTHFNQVSMLA